MRELLQLQIEHLLQQQLLLLPLLLLALFELLLRVLQYGSVAFVPPENDSCSRTHVAAAGAGRRCLQGGLRDAVHVEVTLAGSGAVRVGVRLAVREAVIGGALALAR